MTLREPGPGDDSMTQEASPVEDKKSGLLRRGALDLHSGGVVVAVALVAAYVVVLLSQLSAIVSVSSWNADNANMLNLAEDLPSLANGEVVNMGNAPIFSTLWSNVVLAIGPGSHARLEWAPIVWYLIGAGLLVWAVHRAVGRRTAFWAAALLVCLNPVSLQLVTSHALHGPTWFTAAALAAYVVRVASSPARPRWIGFAVGTGAGLIAGANVASDPLTVPVAVLPVLLTLAIMGWRGDVTGRRPFREQAGTFSVATVAAALGSQWIGHAMGITADLPPRKLATLDQMWSSLLQSADNTMSFFGPAPFGGEVSAMGALRLVVGVFGLIGIVVLMRATSSSLKEIRVGRSARHGTPLVALRLYWGASVLFGLLVVLTSPLAFEVRESSVRYEFNLFFASVVGLSLWLGTWGVYGQRVLIGIAAAAALVGMTGVLDEADGRRAFEQSGMVVDGPRAIAYALSRGATRGYAGYWNAGPLRWHTGATVLPVANCETPSGKGFCSTRFALLPSLLHPSAGAKSFVVIDPVYPGAPTTEYLSAFGRPDETRQIGAVSLVIYPYDIGTRFGRS